MSGIPVTTTITRPTAASRTSRVAARCSNGGRTGSSAPSGSTPASASAAVSSATASSAPGSSAGAVSSAAGGSSIDRTLASGYPCPVSIRRRPVRVEGDHIREEHPMKHYLLTVYQPTGGQPPPPDELEQIFRNVEAFHQ